MKIPFKPADILIPQNVDMQKWSVIACDQYTSDIAYWKEVANIVGDNPSTFNMIVPEIYLEDTDISSRIENVNSNMFSLLNSNIFKTLKNSIIYLERAQSNGKIRKGIIGMVDLEEYSYEKGSTSLIRATEGTVVERIPPRVKVRENAYLELPHIMLLIDDPKKEIIEALSSRTSDMELIYDFDLMQNGGHIKGFNILPKDIDYVLEKLELLADEKTFNEKYNTNNLLPLLFAVGDGNHSLATAKTCYENLKKTLPEKEYLSHPARYALVEIVNLHSDALEFEPIHRVVFNVNPEHMIEEFIKYYNISGTETSGQRIEYIYKGHSGVFYVQNSESNLAVGTLQNFIDKYIANNGGKVDYIHGDDATKKLAQEENNIGFLLPKMDKSDFFKSIILDGSLPRKTFSMGHSDDKRFYLESRRIK